ncbi:MAG: hypothetical protein IT285_14885 [Bdellovibrionales bacterium]|nr:hypothetical protein [Bdellovibrionales bacterium]
MNPRYLAMISLLSALGFQSCHCSKGPPSEAARDLFRSSREFMAKEDWKAAHAALDEIIRAYPDAPLTQEDAYDVDPGGTEPITYAAWAKADLPRVECELESSARRLHPDPVKLGSEIVTAVSARDEAALRDRLSSCGVLIGPCFSDGDILQPAATAEFSLKLERESPLVVERSESHGDRHSVLINGVRGQKLLIRFSRKKGGWSWDSLILCDPKLAVGDWWKE